MKKESFTTIISIFKSIKCSQDVVDVNKTKTLHAICDLGALIAKRLSQDQMNVSEPKVVPLPPQLYTPLEDNENENSVESNEKVWLGCEKVLAHFEALMKSNNDEVEAPKQKMLIEETDEFGNEVPLGKIVKLLKSQGQKMGRKQKIPSGSVKAENDDDVLGLVREINLDNQEDLGESEKSKSKKCQTNGKESNEKQVDFATPKRKRSISNNRPHSTKGSKSSDELLLHTPNTDGTKKSLESKLKREKGRNESTETDQLVSPSSSKTTVSKGNKGVKKTHNDIVKSSPKKSANTDSSKRTSELGSLNGSVKKHKPTLVSGLTKCSTHDPKTDVIGHRIKVWWPLDKKFYEGVVESYDPSKKKHTVLYDDGDVEVLNLAKEKWNLIESNDSSVKKQKKDHPGKNEVRSQERTSTSKQTPPSKQKPKKRSSPPKTKGQPKNKRRKISGGKKFGQENSGPGLNDSGSSSSLAHSDVDKDVNSDDHMEEVAVSSPEKDKAGKEDTNMETEGSGKVDGHSLNSKEESDSETLSTWRKRTAKAT
ncbi:hypothetical protein QOZ80_6BG0469640 [Eleusine coracana subsp. coracana]|nr:hypothetical protein QOZ80_6BG0469640 [Eleusine coracana subsp. coracana]